MSIVVCVCLICDCFEPTLVTISKDVLKNAKQVDTTKQLAGYSSLLDSQSSQPVYHFRISARISCVCESAPGEVVSNFLQLGTSCSHTRYRGGETMGCNIPRRTY